MADCNYIGLNVGGKIYRTSFHTTLTRYPGSFFDGLLGGAVPSAIDHQGNYLIDRNGDIFRHVLNFLRCGKLVVPARFDEFHLHLLEQEADFFKLDKLKTAVKDELALTRSARFDLRGLNVGGKIYHTSTSVLERFGDEFSYRLNGPFPLDDQGNYMIDRDGEIFQHVLDFMTSGKLELPERFDELALLEQEADFFKLEPLKEAIKERLEMVGFVINNQVFKLKQKDVLRYKTSLLTTYPKDTQGNYVIEWDMEAVDHVMSYIRYGGIVKDITIDQLRLLRRDAEKLNLHNAAHYCRTVEFMKLNWEGMSNTHRMYIHVYHWLNGPCVMYTNKSPNFFPYDSSFFLEWKGIKIGDCCGKVAVGKVGLNNGHPTVDDIVSIFSHYDNAEIQRIPLQSDCTLIDVTQYSHKAAQQVYSSRF